VEAVDAEADVPLSELRVDGGAAANALLLQFQADQLGIPVVRPTVTETTALGAAYVAGLAVGFWDGFDELRGLWREDRRFEPSMDASIRERLYAGWKKAVGKSLDWID